MFTPATTLHFDAVNNRAKIVDDTDVSSLDLNLVQVTGTGTVAIVGGNVIATGVTIDRSAGDTESAWFDLPESTSEEILNGQYSLVYTLTFTVSGAPVGSFTTAPDTIVITGEDWEDIFDEVGASNSVTIAGATTPGNDGAAPITGVAVVLGDTVLSTSKTLVAEAGGSATISFTVTYNSFVNTTYTYTGCDEVTPCVEVVYDCDSTVNGQIIFQDTTVLPSDQSLVSRVFQASYPPNLTDPVTPAPVTTSGDTIVINTLATGTWAYSLVLNINITQSDGLIVSYSVSTSDEEKVSCIGTFCGLLKCWTSLLSQYADAYAAGKSVSQYQFALTAIPNLYGLAKESKQCGETDQCKVFIAQAQAILGKAGCGCGCDDDEPNHWINNSQFEVNGPQFNAAIFSNTLPFGGSTPSGIDAVQPNTGLLNKLIKPSFFQFANELAVKNITYSQKTVEIKFNTYNGGVGTASMAVSIGGQTITTALLSSIPADFATRTEITIGTIRNGTSTVFGIQVKTDYCDNGNGTLVTETTYEEFPDLIASTDDLVVSLTPGGVGVAGLITTQYSIKPVMEQ